MFKTVIRNLQRNKGITFINISGLAVGMAVCLLIGLYIEDELSFDRFHKKGDHLYVVTGGSLQTPYSLATALESVSGVAQTTRFWKGSTITITVGAEEHIVSRNVLLAEPSFFEVFSFPAVAGAPSATLNNPGAGVITQSMATLFFGSEDPIGKTLAFQRNGPGEKTQSITIGAVVKDAPPNSSIRFDLIAPLTSLGPVALQENNWGFDIFETYVKTTSPLPADRLSARVAEAMKQHIAPGPDLTFSALPLHALHLSGFTTDGFKGQVKFLYIFGTIALFVLLIAAVNYVNLLTAQAARRMREVGIRKVMGAGRVRLIRQFLGESALLSFAALVISLGLVKLTLPAFSLLFGKELSLWGAEYGFTLPALILIVLLLAVLASIYPAFALSRFRPTEALQSNGAKAAQSRTFGFRQGLVVLQFTVSTALIIGTVVIYYQLQYIQNKDLGFDSEQVVVVELGSKMPESVRESFRERIVSHHGVLNASIPNAVPDRFNMGYTRPVNEAAPQSGIDQESILFRPAIVDYDFIPTLQIPILAGRNFSRDFPADASHAYLLNKAAAEQLGWSADEAIGKTFKLGTEDTPEGKVIGVVDNFHIASLHKEIEPVVLQLHTLSPAGSIPFVLAAKLAPGTVRNTVDHIRGEFNRIAPPGTPFQYSFLDDRFEAMYRSEERMSRIATSFAGIAVFIACLGLLGLAASTAERRTKEIGIRKVLGASVSGIVALLSGEFVKLVLIAIVIASPVSWWAMNRWLQDFAYRIDIEWWMFAVAGLAAVAIALLTISWQAIRAAMANPVESLRAE